MKRKILRSGLSIFFMCTFLTNLVFAQDALDNYSLRKLAVDESETYRTTLANGAATTSATESSGVTRRGFLGAVGAGVLGGMLSEPVKAQQRKQAVSVGQDLKETFERVKKNNNGRVSSYSWNVAELTAENVRTLGEAGFNEIIIDGYRLLPANRRPDFNIIEFRSALVEASIKGIKIKFTVGGPDWAYGGAAAARQITTALCSLLASMKQSLLQTHGNRVAEVIEGIVVDIEPHGEQAWKNEGTHDLREYVGVHNALEQIAQARGLTYEMAEVFWFGQTQLEDGSLLRNYRPPAKGRLYLMSYRNTAAGTMAVASDQGRKYDHLIGFDMVTGGNTGFRNTLENLPGAVKEAAEGSLQERPRFRGLFVHSSILSNLIDEVKKWQQTPIGGQPEMQPATPAKGPVKAGTGKGSISARVISKSGGTTNFSVKINLPAGVSRQNLRLIAVKKTDVWYTQTETIRAIPESGEVVMPVLERGHVGQVKFIVVDITKIGEIPEQMGSLRALKQAVILETTEDLQAQAPTLPVPSTPLEVTPPSAAPLELKPWQLAPLLLASDRYDEFSQPAIGVLARTLNREALLSELARETSDPRLAIAADMAMDNIRIGKGYDLLAELQAHVENPFGEILRGGEGATPVLAAVLGGALLTDERNEAEKKEGEVPGEPADISTGLGRRDFLRISGAGAVAVGLLQAAGQSPSAAELILSHGLMLSGALQRAAADRMQRCARFVAGQKQALDNTNFSGLHKSYARDPNRSDSNAERDAGYIEQYGRTWAGYDSALGGFVELIHNDRDSAKKTVDALVALAKDEESKGFKGFLHFSYNTSGDTFIDPRGPLGANAWGIKVILAYIVETGDTTHLDFISDIVENYLLGQQVMDEADPRYGLFRFGLYNATDFAKGDAMGYTVYEGDVNTQNEGVAIEHAADAIDVLRLMGLVLIRWKTEPQKLTQKCIKGHDIGVQALDKLWVDDHFVTGMSDDGKVNKSVAVDNNTWVASVLVNYDSKLERVWKCIEWTMQNFVTEVAIDECENLPEEGAERYKQFYGDKKLKGTFFFEEDFTDSVVPRLGARAEQMLQPESTFGFIHLLMQAERRFGRYAQYQKDEAIKKEFLRRQDECRALAVELIESMIRLQVAYGGQLPYATKAIENYFNTLPGMASNATAAVVLKEALDGRVYPYFLGVTPHESFVINKEKMPKPGMAKKSETEKEEMAPVEPTPATTSEKEEMLPVEPAPAPEEEQMAPAAEKPAAKKAAESKIKIKVEKASEFEIEFTVEGAPEGAVAAGYAKTDVWYIQPLVDELFEIKEGEPITIDNSRGTFGEKKAMILIFKNREAYEEMKKILMDDSMLRDWEIEKTKKYILKAVIIDSFEKKTLREVSQAELMRALKIALVRTRDGRGQARAQLAVDLGELDRAPAPAAGVKTRIGMGFNYGGRQRPQKQPAATLIAYLGEPRLSKEIAGERATISLTTNFIPAQKPAPLLAGVGAMAMPLAGQSI